MGVDGALASIVAGQREDGIVAERAQQPVEITRPATDVLRRLVGVSTPNRAAVAGISCISPPAPLGLNACGLPPDSTAITATSSGRETLCRAASRSRYGP